MAAVVEIPSRGRWLLPRELEALTGEIAGLTAADARGSPREVLDRLAAGGAVVLSGPFTRIDAVYRYCQHFQRDLVARDAFAGIADRAQRSAARTQARWRKLHRLLVMVRGDALVDVDDPPCTAGLQEWLDRPPGARRFLIPFRRLQRIRVDMRRAREGIHVDVLGASITIRPHVYVPHDQSVPAMFAHWRPLLDGRRVLDMGTGTGILALLAARLGASEVVATDSNPWAVTSARANAERLGVGHSVQVRGPADLFDSVGGERFDAILFNAPWILGEPRTLYDTATHDPGYRVITGFMRRAPDHLAPSGSILLQYSDVSQRAGQGSMKHLDALLVTSGLRVVESRWITRVSRVLGARERVSVFRIRSVDGR